MDIIMTLCVRILIRHYVLMLLSCQPDRYLRIGEIQDGKVAGEAQSDIDAEKRETELKEIKPDVSPNLCRGCDIY
jgi:hypothetical protein